MSDRRVSAIGVGVDGTEPQAVTQIRHGVTNLGRFPPWEAASRRGRTCANTRARRQTADPRADNWKQRVARCSPLGSLSGHTLVVGTHVDVDALRLRQRKKEKPT